MTAAVSAPPLHRVDGGAGPADGGRPARQAMVRWAWRLFQREWRRQALVLGLLILAVAATVIGLGVVSNAANLKADPQFGTANTMLILQGPDPQLASQLVVLHDRFGPVEAVAHQTVAVPGSVATVDLRAQDPHGVFGHVTLRVDAGRFPTAPGEVAVTSGVAQTFALHLGSTWTSAGRSLSVVGIVENPLDLQDQFALVPPGQDPAPDSVAVLLNASQSSLQSFRLPGRGVRLGINSRGTGQQGTAEAAVLVLATLGLIFVGLMAVAGFAVMAHRRLRAIGMLGALGATDRHVRLVMLVTGGAVGATGAVAGAAVGLVAWFAFAPTLQSLVHHRVNAFNLPWWAVAATLVLTFVTAVTAAWWPARAVVRIPIVAALSGRPPRPRPAHRFAAVGAIMVAGGVVLLAFADRNRAAFIIIGTAATAIGLLFFSPLAIRLLAAATGRASVAFRLAVRDLVRYQARSGAALGAITLAVGISATIAISAAVSQTPNPVGNLPANQLMLYLSSGGPGSPVPPVTALQQQGLATRIDQLASAIHATSVVPLEQVYDPNGAPMAAPQPNQPPGYQTAALAQVVRNARGEEIFGFTSLYLATPDVLRHYGLSPAQIEPTADVVSRAGIGTMQVLNPDAFGGPPVPSGSKTGPPRVPGIAHPKVQILTALPAYTSAPGTLITLQAMRALGLQPLPSGWLLQTSQPITAAQISTARRAAAEGGLYVESRTTPGSTASLRNWSTAAGILVALGVLGMTVGLIRSETAGDLRTLTATGAGSGTRRSLTGVTAGALALLGAGLGTAGAYGALLAWHRSDLTPLGRVPVSNLIVILVGLPLIATLGGWLLAGAEPSGVARRPMD